MGDSCPNPLFAGWLKEWMDEASERNSKGQIVYKKAWQSMKACTTVFEHASQAEVLNGIGPKLCSRLAAKHEAHCEANGLPKPMKPRRGARTSTTLDEDQDTVAGEVAEERPKKKRKQAEYVPKLRSGAYALIMTLAELDEEGRQALPKKELIERAQPHCDASFTVPSDTTKFYTAWKSMQDMEKKELVCTKGHPTKRYYLSDDGWEVAKRMQNAQKDPAARAHAATKKKADKTNAVEIARCPGESSVTGPQKTSFEVTELSSDSEKAEQRTPLPKLIPIKDSGPSGRRVSTANILCSKPIVLRPGTFEVKLLLDNREVRAKNDRDYISKELRAKHDIVAGVRALPLGDVLWVAQLKPPFDSAFQAQNDGDDEECSTEIVLEHVIERKRLDDLVASLKDGRFHEQKFRLKKSGFRNVTYLIEDFSMSAERQEQWGLSVESAIASMQVVDDIFVKQTTKVDDTINYLARMHKSLKRSYEQRELHVLPSRALDVSIHHSALAELRGNSPSSAYCITFSAFCSLCDKSDDLTLRDLYLKMLMCMRGVTGDKAIEIQRIWPTPNALIEAYNNLGSDTKARDTMISHHLGKEIDRKQVGKTLSAKIAEVWAG